MKRVLFFVATLTSFFGFAFTGNGYASLIIGAVSTPVAVSFASFDAPATWAAAAPAPNQLDSDTWHFNSSNVSQTTTAAAFGGNITGGLGVSTGGVTSFGVYAFDVSSGVRALGVQPTAADWTPGMFTLRLQNQTGQTLNSIAVDWDVWVFNNEGRSSDFRFYISGDNMTYTDVPSQAVTSTAVADPNPVAWAVNNRSHTITGLNVANNAFYYVRWGGADVSGSGSRDEFGLAGIRVVAVPEPTAMLMVGMAIAGCVARRRRIG